MATKFSRWLGSVRRYFGESKTIRRPHRNTVRSRMERLEDKVVPAVFGGGLSVAAGDVDGDGLQDMVVGAGPGGTPRVTAYSGKTGAIIRSFDAFESTFTGGVNIALGDVNGDGRADVIVGAGRGGTPHVKVFDVLTGFKFADFLAYSKRFTGGVNVASADFTGDGKADIVTAPGQSGGPQVQIFDATTGKAVLSFFAFDQSFLGGVSVAAGDVTGDGKNDLVVGAGPTGAPIVRVFEPLNGNTNSRNFLAYDENFRGGVNVGVADIGDYTALDIVTGAGAGGGPHVEVFSSQTGRALRSFYAYDPNFTGGVDVAVRDVDYNGLGVSEILVAPQSNGGPHVRAFDGETSASIVNFFAFGDSTGQPLATTPFASAGDKVAPTLQILTPSPSPTNPQRTNLTVTGKATDDRTTASVQVKVDSGAFQNVAVDAGGNFSFTSSFALNGSQDGKHTLTFQARDKSGNTSSASTVSFTLDTVVTTPVSNLADASDTGTKGDLITSLSTVTITGKTDPSTDVTIVETGATTKSDGAGAFTFAGINLKGGANAFTIRATDSLGNTADGKITITLNTAPVVSTPIPDQNVSKNAANTVLDLTSNFSDANVTNSLVRINTNFGPIEIELFDSQAPLTVANFLNYARRGDYNNTIFHRLVNNFVLQGGGFRFNAGPPVTLPAITTDPAVVNEPGILNTRGTLAMAKFGNQPDSATSQFFFNLADNTNLDTQNGGFTVFARVTSGMDVVDKLAELPIRNMGGVFNEIPLQDYTGSNFPTDTEFRNYAAINSVSIIRQSDRLTYSVTSNSNSALVTTTITGNKLTLAYAANQTGTATITIRATDSEGQFTEDTFVVNVT